MRRHPNAMVLDGHLVVFPKPCQAGLTVFAEETDFLAAPWRLTLDTKTFESPPSFFCGTSVNIFNLNGSTGQYVVDACHWIHDGNAYLRVLWRDNEQRVGNPYHDTHPTFMLVVPTEWNNMSNVEEQLRLDQKSEATMTEINPLHLVRRQWHRWCFWSSA